MKPALLHPLQEYKFVCKLCRKAIHADIVSERLYSKDCHESDDGYHRYDLHSIYTTPLINSLFKVFKWMGFESAGYESAVFARGKFIMFQSEKLKFLSLPDKEQIELSQRIKDKDKLNLIKILLTELKDLEGAVEYLSMISKGSVEYNEAEVLIYEQCKGFILQDPTISKEVIKLVVENNLFDESSIASLIEQSSNALDQLKPQKKDVQKTK